MSALSCYPYTTIIALYVQPEFVGKVQVCGGGTNVAAALSVGLTERAVHVLSAAVHVLVLGLARGKMKRRVRVRVRFEGIDPYPQIGARAQTGLRAQP